MRISKLFLAVLLFCVSATTALAQPQTRPFPLPPNPPEPFVYVYGNDGGFLGIHPQAITNENVSKFNLKEPRGVAVEKVIEGSPAAKAGLQNGDVILKFNGEEVTSIRKLNRLLDEVTPDHKVKLTISKNGEEKDVFVTMGKRKREMVMAPPFDVTIPQNGELFRNRLGRGNIVELNFPSPPRIGVNTIELNQQLANHFGVTSGKGILITEVIENSPADKAGLKAGDVITLIDSERVEEKDDLPKAFNKKKEGEEVTLTIIRDKSERLIKVVPSR